MPTPILQPGEIEAGAPPAPWLKLPAASPFAARAQRLEALAADHALADYLRFVAALCRAQHEAYALLPAAVPPSAATLERCRIHAMPPLDAANLARDAAWHPALKHILSAVSAQAAAPARAAIERLGALDAPALAAVAGGLLRHDGENLDRAAAPFVAAALQVYGHRLAAALDVRDVGRP